MLPEFIQGDARAIPLEDESVQTVVTSPPYWGLRDYGLEPTVWGGKAECPHEWGEEIIASANDSNRGSMEWSTGGNPAAKVKGEKPSQGSFCRHCNAWRGTLGLEPAPSLYVEHLVQIFREVKRVLRKDGTIFLNLGDSYARQAGDDSTRGRPNTGQKKVMDAGADMSGKGIHRPPPGLKPKDLIGIPWMVAFALRQPYHTGCIKDPLDRAWLAGLVDADGSIGIRIHRNPRYSNPTYIPHLNVCSSDLAGLEKCVRITGLGRINLKHKAGFTDKRKITSRRDFYTWRLDGQIANKVIRDIFPFLTIKRLQAQLAYNQNLSLKWGRPTRSKPVPPKVARYREQLYECCKKANRREECDLPHLDPVDPAEEPGWYLRSEIIWHKNNSTPESVKDRPTRSHEQIFLLSKEARYYYDADAIREPHKGVSLARARRNRHGGKYRDSDPLEHGSTKRGANYGPDGDWDKICSPGGRNKRSVWTVSTEGYGGGHFATFPPALITPSILAGAPPRGVVFDPFSGSGTTAWTACRLGRRGIGLDLAYQHLSRRNRLSERIEPPKDKGNLSLFA